MRYAARQSVARRLEHGQCNNVIEAVQGHHDLADVGHGRRRACRCDANLKRVPAPLCIFARISIHPGIDIHHLVDEEHDIAAVNVVYDRIKVLKDKADPPCDAGGLNAVPYLLGITCRCPGQELGCAPYFPCRGIHFREIFLNLGKDHVCDLISLVFRESVS